MDVAPSRQHLHERAREELSDSAEPRWLAPREREAWLGLVRIMETLPGVLDAQLQRDAALNFFEYTVLANIAEQPAHTVVMTRLAEVTNSSLSRLSHAVKRLEARGLVVRHADPEDRRCTLALLTEAGLDLVQRTAPAHVEHVRNVVFDALPPRAVKELCEISRAILSFTDPDDRTRPSTPAQRGGLKRPTAGS